MKRTMFFRKRKRKSTASMRDHKAYLNLWARSSLPPQRSNTCSRAMCSVIWSLLAESFRTKYLHVCARATKLEASKWLKMAPSVASGNCINECGAGLISVENACILHRVVSFITRYLSVVCGWLSAVVVLYFYKRCTFALHFCFTFPNREIFSWLKLIWGIGGVQIARWTHSLRGLHSLVAINCCISGH